jgi:hypothetical protein
MNSSKNPVQQLEAVRIKKQIFVSLETIAMLL